MVGSLSGALELEKGSPFGREIQNFSKLALLLTRAAAEHDVMLQFPEMAGL